jgi:hypothetical protein
VVVLSELNSIKRLFPVVDSGAFEAPHGAEQHTEDPIGEALEDVPVNRGIKVTT